MGNASYNDQDFKLIMQNNIMIKVLAFDSLFLIGMPLFCSKHFCGIDLW